MGEMFGTSLNVPLLIRTPMGGGRGYGATHSQSLEKFLAAIPGIDVFLMHPRVNVSAFFEQTVSSLKRPAILVEHKLLYAHSLEKELPSGCELFDVERAGKTVGSVLKTSETPDVTMVCFGGVGLKAEAAMERLAEEEIYCDLYYPFSLNEFPVEAVIESLTRTGRLLTVEEGTLSCGLGSEIVSKLLEKCEDPFLLKRVGALDRPLAASPEIENQILPSESKIFQAAVALFEKEVTV